MTLGSELVFDLESTEGSVDSGVRVGRLLLGTGAMVAIIIVIATQLMSGPTLREGGQAALTRPIVLDRPAVDRCEPLLPVGGELLAGFPRRWFEPVTEEAVDHNRIHLSGSTAALRLENGRELASIQWSTRSQTYHCVAYLAA
ncbi:MAG: hypothetical protein ACJA14_002798 [Ilumatobacter sp.]|jgi:hypothetical protein